MKARWLLPAGAIALLVNCKAPELDITGAGVQGPGAVRDEGNRDALLDRGVAVGRCQPADTLPDLVGVWAYRFETRSTVSGGSLSGPIEETVTRYGIAEFCQDGQAAIAALTTCDFHQSPIYDDGRQCAAQVPSIALLAALPPSGLQGTVPLLGVESTLNMTGWRETWGLEPGVALPAEPSGVEPAESSLWTDQDDDDDPGVTLASDGEVPTVSWAARDTVAAFSFSLVEDTQLAGTTSTAMAQTIIGGPGTRALRGRVRQPLPGDASFLRVDGRLGAPSLDLNRDGAITCRELFSLIGGALPAPRAAACRR